MLECILEADKSSLKGPTFKQEKVNTIRQEPSIQHKYTLQNHWELAILIWKD